jgi:hypothetical protein
MYQHRPNPSWQERLLASARTLAALVLVAILAAALASHWGTQVSATGSAIPPTALAAQAPVVPVSIDGTVVSVSEDKIAVQERGGAAPVAFPVVAESQAIRAGENVPVDALRAGDAVRMTIDGRTGTVLRIHASPVGGAAIQVPGSVALLAALGLIAGATALAIVNRDRLPVLPARRAAPRLLPVAVTR